MISFSSIICLSIYSRIRITAPTWLLFLCFYLFFALAEACFSTRCSVDDAPRVTDPARATMECVSTLPLDLGLKCSYRCKTGSSESSATCTAGSWTPSSSQTCDGRMPTYLANIIPNFFKSLEAVLVFSQDRSCEERLIWIKPLTSPLI